MYNTFHSSLKERPIFLNKFNPTLKVVCVILLLVLVFLKVNFVAQLFTLILIVSLWIAAKLPFSKFKPIMRTILIIFVFIFIINWLVAKSPGFELGIEQNYELWGSDWATAFSKGLIFKYNDYYWVSGRIWGGSIGTIKTFSPTDNYVMTNLNNINYYLSFNAPLHSLSSLVVVTTMSMLIKLFCMLMVFSLLVNTTSTLQLTYAFEHLLWPLKWIKVPVTEISYIIAVGISFVPNLFEETNQILRGQASRGSDFKNGSIITKIKTMKSIVIPMFSVSFNQADQLSDAMEVRNFVPRAKRTKYRVYHCLASNWTSFVILLLLLGLFIYFRVKKVIIYPFIRIDCFNI